MNTDQWANGTVTVMDDPEFGYGKGQRPLWSPRDRDAEAIRRTLRRGGFVDFDERHLDGFAVEGANTSQDGTEPFVVSYCGTRFPETVQRYQQVLEQAGYQVSVNPQDAQILLVQRPPMEPPPSPDRPPMTAIVCAVLAAVALVASWVGTGPVRTTAGISSAILGVLAAFLAASWYRRRLDEQAGGRPGTAT
ncbi:hypothetical protein GA0070606_0041 [Micromonospora citrea]|uniref:Uncharacterized protein n=2 Tax=Micromonospora citrea TaxID=47855 RepID=A0A1C6TPZ8_9ACTN|nr:hypothetical protein GA0070606_0041 [Micromonospora citrea]